MLFTDQIMHLTKGSHVMKDSNHQLNNSLSQTAWSDIATFYNTVIVVYLVVVLVW